MLKSRTLQVAQATCLSFSLVLTSVPVNAGYDTPKDFPATPTKPTTQKHPTDEDDSAQVTPPPSTAPGYRTPPRVKRPRPSLPSPQTTNDDSGFGTTSEEASASSSGSDGEDASNFHTPLSRRSMPTQRGHMTPPMLSMSSMGSHQASRMQRPDLHLTPPRFTSPLGFGSMEPSGLMLFRTPQASPQERPPQFSTIQREPSTFIRSLFRRERPASPSSDTSDELATPFSDDDNIQPFSMNLHNAFEAAASAVETSPTEDDLQNWNVLRYLLGILDNPLILNIAPEALEFMGFDESNSLSVIQILSQPGRLERLRAIFSRIGDFSLVQSFHDSLEPFGEASFLSALFAHLENGAFDTEARLDDLTSDIKPIHESDFITAWIKMIFEHAQRRGMITQNFSASVLHMILHHPAIRSLIARATRSYFSDTSEDIDAFNRYSMHYLLTALHQLPAHLSALMTSLQHQLDQSVEQVINLSAAQLPGGVVVSMFDATQMPSSRLETMLRLLLNRVLHQSGCSPLNNSQLSMITAHPEIMDFLLTQLWGIPYFTYTPEGQAAHPRRQLEALRNLEIQLLTFLSAHFPQYFSGLELPPLPEESTGANYRYLLSDTEDEETPDSDGDSV